MVPIVIQLQHHFQLLLKSLLFGMAVEADTEDIVLTKKGCKDMDCN